MQKKSSLKIKFPVSSQNEKHALFETKMVKINSNFQTKTAQKPYLLELHIPIKHIRGSIPQESKWLD